MDPIPQATRCSCQASAAVMDADDEEEAGREAEVAAEQLLHAEAAAASDQMDDAGRA